FARGFGLLLFACSCGEGAGGAASSAKTATPARSDEVTLAPSGVAPPLPTAQRAPATLKSATPDAARPPTCAPSLAHRRRIDGRTAEALERCENLDTGLSKIAAKSCGIGERKAKDMERFVASVPPLDDATVARIRGVFERGKTLGRNPKVFG